MRARNFFWVGEPRIGFSHSGRLDAPARHRRERALFSPPSADTQRRAPLERVRLFARDFRHESRMSALTMRSAVPLRCDRRRAGRGRRASSSDARFSPLSRRPRGARSRRATVRTEAAFVSSGVTTSDLKEAGGKS